MSKVKLAIRVRPFTEGELKQNRQGTPVVKVEDEYTVSITNLKVAASGAGDSRLRVRRYHADHCFDSSCTTENGNYASQEKVYELLGSQVLETLSRGQSACVLAYGQSATGKTHTMMGTDDEPGLVPRLCRDIATGSVNEQGQVEDLNVTISFLEIYNERVHDLLCEEAKGEGADGGCAGYNSLPRRRGNVFKDLRVREHPTRGPYVQNLRRVQVRGAGALCSLVAAGASRRRTAPTRRNPASSRSHALLQITTPTATLHLADLAGSEKASLEGSYHSRQKEGANINKSLVALSNVISALVAGGSRGRFVPYRDSAVTWLLKDCFTGGAATFIIATLSPSWTCYGESASTLRWAARARQLPATSQAGLSAVASARRTSLQDQLAALRAALLKYHIRFIPETGNLVQDPSYRTQNTIIVEIPELVTTSKEDPIKDMNSLSNSVENETNRLSSTESSVTSTSSDRLEVKQQIGENYSVDNVFGPILERTVSGHDLKIIPPLRNKRRQYKSHEVLPLINNPKLGILPVNVPRTRSSIDHSTIESNEKFDVLSVSSDHNGNHQKTKHVPFKVDNQRAEIVASVTERLYSKLKKKDDLAESKVEDLVDKKNMEPLHELKICTNARQRLVEMGQRALRSKRKICIPAHTQTKNLVIRVKDQSVDTQSDLEPYCIKYDSAYKYHQNAYTETIPITPRCKEIAVGPSTGSIYKRDSSTVTDETTATYKSCSMMTDILPKSDVSTQTLVVTTNSKKKKISAFRKYLAGNSSTMSPPKDVATSASIINISISQAYPDESESLSDDSLETYSKENIKSQPSMTPDLLNNHNSIEQENPNIHVLNSAQSIETHDNINEKCDIPDHSKTMSVPKINDTAFNDKSNIEVFSIRTDDCSPPASTSGVNHVNGSFVYDKSSEHYQQLLALTCSVDDCKPNEKYLNDMNLPPPPEKCNISVNFKPKLLPQVVSTSTQTSLPNRLRDQLSNYLTDSTTNTEDCKLELQMGNQLITKCCDLGVPTSTFCQKKNTHSIFGADNAHFEGEPNYKTNSRSTFTEADFMYNNNIYNQMLPRYCSYDRNCEEIKPLKTFEERLNLSDNNTSDGDAHEIWFKKYSKTNSDLELCSYSDESTNHVQEFKNKKQLFENKTRKNSWLKYTKGFNYSSACLDNIISRSCDRLERSIQDHENYLTRLNGRISVNVSRKSVGPSYVKQPPSEYLRQLLELRRDVVNRNQTNNDEKLNSFYGFV